MAGHIPAAVFSGASFNWLSLRLRRAGMLMYGAAITWLLSGSLAWERVVNLAFDGDVLPDTTRSQIRRLPPVTW
jgi:hypothetical protein